MRRLKVDDNVRELAREYANLRFNEKEAEAKRKEYGQEVLEVMQRTATPKVKVDFDEATDATVAVKHRETVKIDEDRLKKALGAKVFNKLTTPVLDEAKVEAAIKLGEVDPNVVEACLETTTRPYLEARFTKKRMRG